MTVLNMFTGIIEQTGTIEKLSANRMVIKSAFKGLKLGESIAINGICLTVSALDERQPGVFSVDVSPETLAKTSLQSTQPGAAVNLERALEAGGRLGGHFVTGHISGTGAVVSLTRQDDFYLIGFSAPPELMKYIVPKGSIAVDGISLTVVETDPKNNRFTVAVIPHTLKVTTLGIKKTKDPVNLEPDILAKYAEAILSGNSAAKKELNLDFLKEKGF